MFCFLKDGDLKGVGGRGSFGKLLIFEKKFLCGWRSECVFWLVEKSNSCRKRLWNFQMGGGTTPRCCVLVVIERWLCC